ncbi:sigma-E processing peptidase SpoIIGA [Clostridium chauvoei]|uniref:Sporulation sigma-E factor-processing peptidase n=2 Tax=Clostridium chauvoei TaxID=46867 RepID=A0A1U6J9R8_9CLOT|nr:sigma-E processing peptidase SpoIIGA [Clostridium chauvoei]ATD54891.1 peptidase U4 [Clostridium chauvoei]ATD57430.1 peptidase U4 [Clostridium chauvoei]MBX7280496.1 sigma-E processing peptidase SpoIIGA [Clostridium chauvoei]MBX7282981.1 sigma-E processing peptidase SpoIIGA [Clostridium chauvoei]MBX7285498.1 sigma-E processing peptidase SpoIIGA [Clostridium chauvoei]
MVVYVDVVFIENFIVNLFLLLITMKLLRFEYRKSIYVGAVLGGLYTLALFIKIPVLTSLVGKILVALIMIMLTVKKRTLGTIIKAVITFFIGSFTLCGICFTFSLMQNQYSISKDFIISNYSIKYIIVSIMILYIVIVRIVDYLRERALIKNLLYDIEFSYNEKKVCLKGFLDTGNELREPVTNLPCIIVENELIDTMNIPDEKAYYISYSTIGEDGKLKGFKGEKIKVRQQNEDWRTIDAIICSCKNNKLSKENEFNALLSRGII